MVDDKNQTACDDWQTELYEGSHSYARKLKKLHEANPWPQNPVLEHAINTLATELWDQSFSATEIASAFRDAASDLPRYTAGDDVRP